jgi:predicted transcriptional regulator
MLGIRLAESIEKRLEKLARRTGRTKTFYVREAILEHLDVSKIGSWQNGFWNASAVGKNRPFHLRMY